MELGAERFVKLSCGAFSFGPHYFSEIENKRIIIIIVLQRLLRERTTPPFGHFKCAVPLVPQAKILESE